MENKSVLNFKEAKVKIDKRDRNRMKIVFKLNQEQSEAFKNFSTIKPDNVSEEDFFKHIFFSGIRVLNEELRRMLDENKAKLEEQARKEMENKESDVD